MPPKLLEFKEYQALVPMSFFATGYAIFYIMGVMMPAFGVAHHHHNVMPLGKTIAQGYHYGPANMLTVIIALIVAPIQWGYIMDGLMKIPDLRMDQVRYMKWLYWPSQVAAIFLFFLPQHRVKIGPFQYGLHEIAGNIWMVLTAFWMLVFAQWCESKQGRNAIAVGCGLTLMGVIGNLIESGIHNSRHGGPFQYFGLAVMLGTELMTMFGCEMWTYIHFNASGFPGAKGASSSSADVVSSKSAAGAGDDYTEV